MLNKILKFFLVVFIVSCLPKFVYADSLSPEENQIRVNVSAEKNSQLQLLKKIVNINSNTTNVKGVRKVGEILRAQLQQLGFKTYWINEPRDMNRAGTLIAEHNGKNKNRILLIGHLDTVFPKQSKFQSFKQRGNIITGPGVIDAKGGDVILISALKALKKSHVLDDASITVVLTGDEEDSGKPTNISRKPLYDVAHKSKLALDFEWGISLDTGTIARRGVSSWSITTQGNEAHSAGIFEKNAGYGAIFELARILNTMRTKLSDEKYLTFNPGISLGGSDISFDANNSTANVVGKKNVIAKTAVAKGDLRFLTEKQQKSAQEKMLAIVKQHLPGTNATIEFKNGIPAMPPSRSNLWLLKKFSAVNKDLGYGNIRPLDPGMRGAGDISFVANIVSSSLSGLGPIGSGAHTENETLELNSLPITTERAAILIYRLTRA